MRTGFWPLLASPRSPPSLTWPRDGRSRGSRTWCGAYRIRYRYERNAGNPYAPPSLERPSALSEEPPTRIYPWEQIFLAAATCAGSDYPMLAEHAGIPLDRVDFVVEGVFDPRGEFEGLDGLEAPPDARPRFLSLHLRATLVSKAPREQLERLHERVVTRNMVLGALRGVPMTSELSIAAV